MPELPEVETIRKALEKQITNKKIIDFHIGNKKLRFDQSNWLLNTLGRS